MLTVPRSSSASSIGRFCASSINTANTSCSKPPSFARRKSRTACDEVSTSRPRHREREGTIRGKEKAAPWSAPVCSGRDCPRPAPARCSAVVSVRRRPPGRKRTPCAQTLTARTAWYVEGNSKSTPTTLHCPGQAQRASQERRDGRRRQGSKPHGRDSARGMGRSPRARRRHAETPSRS